jgi:hypothetical protein
MILNFMTTFPDKVPGIGGTPTEFRRKILGCATVNTQAHHYSANDLNHVPAKLHTIREDAKGRWKAGNKIHFAQGGYTRGRVFAEAVCTGVQPIEMDFSRGERVWIIDGGDGRLMRAHEVERIAANDGFRDAADFYAYFRWACDGTSFRGKIIHWTDTRY